MLKLSFDELRARLKNDDLRIGRLLGLLSHGHTLSKGDYEYRNRIFFIDITGQEAILEAHYDTRKNEYDYFLIKEIV